MIFNSICSIVRRKTHNLIDLTYYPLNSYKHINTHQHSNNFTFSTQQGRTINADESSSQTTAVRTPRKIQIKQAKQNTTNIEKVYKKNLIQLIRDYRSSLMDSQFQFSSFAVFCKGYVSLYSKSNNEEYNRSKDQIQGLLIKLKQCKITKFNLAQLANVLDFIRVTSNLEVINNKLVEQTKSKIFDLLQPIFENVQSLTLNQVSLLYVKLNPLNYPNMFGISKVLHEKLTQRFDEKKGLQVSLMQIFVFLKSMSKKQFLSFHDKKILQMALVDLKLRQKIDNSMIMQISMAFKDIDVKANISNYSLYNISYRIVNKAIKLVQNGIKHEQIQRILISKSSRQQKFQQIIQEIYNGLLAKLKQTHSIFYYKYNLKLFYQAIKQFPSNHRFALADKQTLLDYLTKISLQFHDNSQFLLNIESQMFNIIRTNFFNKDMTMLDSLMKSPQYPTKWSFIFEYSYHNAVFPIQLIERKLQTIQYYNMKIESKFIKRVVSLSKQRRLQPASLVLEAEYQKWLQVIKKYDWQLQSLQKLIKLSYIQDSRLIQQFHNQFNQHYIQRLYPSKDEIERQRKLRKGQKSQLFAFWEYLLLFGGFEKHIPFEIINSIPVYSLYVVCNNIRLYKNRQIVPKVMILMTLNSMLQTRQVNIKEKEMSILLQVLTIYLQDVRIQNEAIVGLFFSIIKTFIREFEKLVLTVATIVKRLIVKLLNTNDLTIRNSRYYRQLVVDLLNNPIIFAEENIRPYFKTSILRQALALNLIHQIHLSQIEFNYFSKNENALLRSLTKQSSNMNTNTNNNPKTQQQQQFNPFRLICYLKADKDNQTIQRDYNIICQTINKSTLSQLSQYLIHYSLQRRELNDKILTKICQKFISSFHLTDNNIDIVSILINVQQKITKIDKRLFSTLMIAILKQIGQHLDEFSLINHLFVLKIAQEQEIAEQGDNEGIVDRYRRSLWRYVRSNKNNGSICLDIMLEMSKIEDMFKADDFQFVECFAPDKPLAYLKVVLLSHQQEHLMKTNKDIISSLFTKPTQKSIFTQYFELKYKKILSKQRAKLLYMKKANPLVLQLLRLLQNAKIQIKTQQVEGQFYYQIGQNLVIFFSENKNQNELNFITKYIKLNAQNVQPIHLPLNLNKKEVVQLLYKLNAKLAQRLNEQQTKKIEQLISLQ